MAPAEVETERLRALDQTGDVGVAPQKIIDELPSNRLLLADHGAPGRLVAVDQHLDRLVHHPQHRLRRRLGATSRVPHGGWHRPPQTPGGRQIQVDGLVGVHARRGGQLTQLSQGGQLGWLGPPALRGGVGQDLEVLAQQLDRHTRLCGRACRHLRHPIRPASVIGVRVWIRCHSIPSRPPTIPL